MFKELFLYNISFKYYIKKILSIFLYTSHSMSISLLPYLIIFIINILYYKLSSNLLVQIIIFIPLIIFINGVLCHSFYQKNKLVILYDVIINILISFYILYNSKYNNQLLLYLILIYISIMFFISNYYNSNFIHIICVQLLFFELYMNERKYILIP